MLPSKLTLVFLFVCLFVCFLCFTTRHNQVTCYEKMTNETLLTTKDKLLWLPREFFEEVLKKHFYKVKSIFCFMCTILIVKGQEVKKKNIQMMRQVSERLTIFFLTQPPT